MHLRFDLPAAHLYSLATRNRLRINAVNVVNKADLLSGKERMLMQSFLSNPLEFKEVIKAKGVILDIYHSISELLQEVLPAQRIPFISAKTERGFDELLDILYEIRCSCGDLT